MKKKIILLDAHAIIHRAYHALPEFSTREGKSTGGLFGVCSMLIKIIEVFKPHNIIACFDLPKPTFRHLAYEEYKGTRKKTDDNLISQIKESRDIFKAFGIDIYDKEGFEADDILGTVAEILKKEKDFEIIIASGDMDTLQLVDEKKVQVYTLKKGINDTILYDESAVFERFGFESNRITDYKGLSGDNSDNIPGIAGIGHKTATALITSLGSLESIYKELEENENEFKEKIQGANITPRILNLLKDGKEEAFFSKELATIKIDVAIDFKFPKNDILKDLNLSKIGDMFREYEFRNMLGRLKKALGIENTEDEIKNKNLFSEKGESQIPKSEVEKLKLAIYLLNPNIAEPTLDDILSFDK